MNIKVRHKELYIIVLLILINLNLQPTIAQVTIGSGYTPNSGSILDLKETESKEHNSIRGLLLPRVALTSLGSLAIAPDADADQYRGAVLYNTTETGVFCKGVYVWSGEEWEQISGANFRTDEYIEGDTESNSFIVPPNTAIRIPVKKAYDIWETTDFGSVDLNSQTGAQNAVLVWQDTINLISDVSLIGTGENAYIEVTPVFDCRQRKGNASVAFTIGGITYWSWHLWITPYNPNTLLGTVPAAGAIKVPDGYVFRNNNGTAEGQYIWMDRFLGAKSIDWHDGALCYGMLYQWGRKDPFPSSSNSLANVEPIWFDLQNQSVSLLKSTTRTKVYAANNPFTYIYGSTVWDSAGAVTDWGQGTAKSAYDPCPKGWRVPHQKGGQLPWRYIQNSGYNTDLFVPAQGNNICVGRRGDAGDLFVFAPYRDTNGSIRGTELNGTARPYSYTWGAWADGSSGRGMYYYRLASNPSGGGINTNTSLAKASAATVRCVAEKDLKE